MTTYLEKLKDPRWQKKRLKILERDGWECQLCTATSKTLHVHHKKYIKDNDPWDYDDHLLTTLCSKCHEKNHPDRSTQEDMLDYFLKNKEEIFDELEAEVKKRMGKT